MSICIFLSMVHGNYMIFTSQFKYWTEDTVYQLKIKSRNTKAIFPASGGRSEMIGPGVFQSRSFLLILYRERQILNLRKFWLSLLLTGANG